MYLTTNILITFFISFFFSTKTLKSFNPLTPIYWHLKWILRHHILKFVAIQAVLGKYRQMRLLGLQTSQEDLLVHGHLLQFFHLDWDPIRLKWTGISLFYFYNFNL